MLTVVSLYLTTAGSGEHVEGTKCRVGQSHRVQCHTLSEHADHVAKHKGEARNM